MCTFIKNICLAQREYSQLINNWGGNTDATMLKNKCDINAHKHTNAINVCTEYARSQLYKYFNFAFYCAKLYGKREF